MANRFFKRYKKLDDNPTKKQTPAEQSNKVNTDKSPGFIGMATT